MRVLVSRPTRRASPAIPVVNAGAEADWLARRTAPGVTFATDFTSDSDVLPYRYGSAMTPSILARVTRFTGDGVTGGSCLKIRSPGGAEGADEQTQAWRGPLNPAWTQDTQGFGNAPWWFQIRVKIPASRLIPYTPGAGSWKFVILANHSFTNPNGAPDQSSNRMSHVLTNKPWRGEDFPILYTHNDTFTNGTPFVGTIPGVDPGSDLDLSPGWDNGPQPSYLDRYCCYSDPRGCPLWPLEEWVTFMVRIKTVTFGGSSGNELDVWWARAGATAWKTLLSRRNYPVGSKLQWTGGFNGMWLTTFETGRFSPGTETYILYDQLIVSTQEIALPNDSAVVTPPTPPGPNSIVNLTLPLNQWVTWPNTAMESQLSPPFGAAAGYQARGSNPTSAIMNNFSGQAWDPDTGRAWFKGGGHDGGSNNMIAQFHDGTWSVRGIPTHQGKYPTQTPYVSGFQWAVYGAAPTQRFHNYFPASESPAGDNAATATHVYGGFVYCPNIDELVQVRHGPFYFQLSSNTWRPGPQTTEGTGRVSPKNRNGIAYAAYYLPSTQRLYFASIETESWNDPADQYFSLIEHNVVTRQDVAQKTFNYNQYESNSCLKGDELWYFYNGGGGECWVHAKNLNTNAVVRTNIATLGYRPLMGDCCNPCAYIPELDKIYMWCTKTRGGGASAGEMLVYDTATNTFSKLTTTGTPPPIPVFGIMSNRMQYWPAHKALIFHTETFHDARILRVVA